jgi:acylphosphatase
MPAPRRSITIDVGPTGAQAGAAVVVKKCLVGGRVQGVFYRATVAQRARELGVTGYAKNLPDGRVEVLACGEAEAVQTLIDTLWTGSSASHVTSVEVTDVSLGESQCPAAFRTG